MPIQVDEEEPWHSLSREDNQENAAEAFAQLEKVKALFQATKQGDSIEVCSPVQ